MRSLLPGIISTHLHADGRYKDLLYCTGGVSRGYEAGSGGRAVIRMAGRETFKVAVTMLGNAGTCLAEAGRCAEGKQLARDSLKRRGRQEKYLAEPGYTGRWEKAHPQCKGK